MDYQVIFDLKNVSLADAAHLGQQVFDDYGADYDAPKGEFSVRIVEVNGQTRWPTDWEPAA